MANTTSRHSLKKRRTHDRIIAARAASPARTAWPPPASAASCTAPGLTIGGFYAHFRSKRAMDAEVVQATLGDSSVPWSVDRYLTAAHRDNAEHGCAFPAMLSEIARADEPTRMAMARAIDARARELARADAGPAGAAARQRALATLALCVGGLALARAMRGHPQATKCWPRAAASRGAAAAPGAGTRIGFRKTPRAVPAGHAWQLATACRYWWTAPFQPIVQSARRASQRRPTDEEGSSDRRNLEHAASWRWAPRRAPAAICCPDWNSDSPTTPSSAAITSTFSGAIARKVPRRSSPSHAAAGPVSMTLTGLSPSSARPASDWASGFTERDDQLFAVQLHDLGDGLVHRPNPGDQGPPAPTARRSTTPAIWPVRPTFTISVSHFPLTARRRPAKSGRLNAPKML